MTIIGLDLGSHWCGVVEVSGDPITSARAQSLDVHALGIPGTAAEIAHLVATSDADTLVVEWGPYYCPRRPRDTDRAWDARNRALQKNREVMVEIFARVRAAVEALPRPVTIAKIACATWRRLIGCEPFTRADGSTGWINDASVREALARRVGPDVVGALDVHGCDALGTALGHLLRPPPIEGGDGRGKSEEQKLRRRILSRESRRRQRNRDYVACGMPARTWGEPPPRNVPVELDGIEATVREHATRLGWSYGRTARRVRLGGLVRHVGAPRGTTQRCETCGLPRRGHVCSGVPGVALAIPQAKGRPCGCVSAKGHLRGLPCPRLAAPK